MSTNDQSHNDPHVISVTRVIPAPPEQIFGLLADPRKHSLIDGSGSVKGVVDGAPERLYLGARFQMRMKIGAPYRITNEVVEFDEPRRIAWRHAGGHVWRYLLEPVEGGTKVTEQFDMTTSKAPWVLRLIRAAQRNRRSMEATLERMAQHFSG